MPSSWKALPLVSTYLHIFLVSAHDLITEACSDLHAECCLPHLMGVTPLFLSSCHWGDDFCVYMFIVYSQLNGSLRYPMVNKELRI